MAATGIKISELEQAAAILQTALIEIAQLGDNFKVPYSLLVPAINGIGRVTVAAAASGVDFDDLLTFAQGTIASVEGTNLEVVTANGPDTGLDNTDLVSWQVFTFGSEQEIVQLAFSTLDTAQQVQIRYGNIYSDATWSAWKLISGGAYADDIPSAYMYKTTNTAQTTALATNTPAELTVTTTAGRLNLFTMPSGGKFKSTSVKPFYAIIQGQISGAATSSVAVYTHEIRKNGASINATDLTFIITAVWNNNSGLKSIPLFTKVLVELDDEINIWVNDVYDAEDFDTWAFNLGITFDGWA